MNNIQFEDSQSNFDELDRSIIALLQQDGSLTNTNIAERLGTSEATVRRRRQSLVEADILRIVAVVDPLKAGFRHTAMIGITVEHGKITEVERALCDLPEIWFVGVTTGGYDIVAEVWFRSETEFLKFITQTINQVAGISRAEFFKIARLSKYTFDWQRSSAK